MDELSQLKEVLIASIEKNGDKPLTLQHLVNIIAMMERMDADEDNELGPYHYEGWKD